MEAAACRQLERAGSGLKITIRRPSQRRLLDVSQNDSQRGRHDFSKKTFFFWLNPPLLKIMELISLRLIRERFFFSNPSLTLIRSLAQALSNLAPYVI
ncbi:hypothetical protein Peur_058954 [Populus x canadensis]